MQEDATRVCGAQFGTLTLYDGESYSRGATYNVPVAFANSLENKLIRPHPKSGLGIVAKTRQVVQIRDLRQSPAYLEGNPAVVGLTDTAGARTLVIVPMLKGAALVGAIASLGQLTAGIAHEIKNPLNFINNFSALSAELVDELDKVLTPAALDKKTREETDELTDMLKGNLEKVVQHGKRADSIVKNMLLHSREGSGERRSVDVNSIVEDSLKLAYHGARAEKQDFSIKLERSFDPAAGMVDLFPQEITRVLLNLISNGVYAAVKQKVEMWDGYEPTLTAATGDLGDRVEIRNSRQWRRHSSGGKRENIQSVLYHQAPRRRDRPRSLPQLRHYRQATRGIDRGRYSTRRIYRIQVILPRKAALTKAGVSS